MNTTIMQKSPATQPVAARARASGSPYPVRSAASIPPCASPSRAPTRAVQRLAGLAAAALAAIAPALGPGPAGAQTGPFLEPVASIYVNADVLDQNWDSGEPYQTLMWQLGLGEYPSIADAGFYSDPPPVFPRTEAFSLYDVSPASVAAPYESLINPHAGVQGATGGGALVIGNGTKVFYIDIPCYWGGNGSPEGPLSSGGIGAFGSLFSHIHYEVRVEAADSVGFTPSAATYTAQAGWTVLTTAALDVFNAAYDDPNNPAYSQMQVPSYAYTPQPGVPDTVINLNQDGSYSVNEVAGDPQWYLGPVAVGGGYQGYIWHVAVGFPQKVVNILRIAVYASLYATPEDGQNGGGYCCGRMFEFPDPFFYYDQLPSKLQTLDPQSPSLTRDIAMAQVNSLYSNPAGEAMTDQLGPTDLSSVQQVVGTVMSEPGDEHLWDYSPNMTVAVLPDNLLTYDFLPYGIIYNPPGNYSGVAQTSTATFSTIMSFATSQGSQQQTANVQGTSFTLGAQGSVGAGFFKAPFGVGATWSQGSSTVNTTSGTTANTTTLSGSETAGYGLGSCSVGCTTLMPQGYAAGARNPTLWPLAPDATDATLGSPWNDAFWYDQIWIIPHPVFATWTLPSATGGTPIPTAQLVGFLQAGQLSAKTAIPYQVRCLYCAAQSHQYCWDEHWQFALSPDECMALLQMDPFYAGSTYSSGSTWQGPNMWQGVKPSDVDPSRFIELRQFPVVDGQDGTFCLSQNSVVSWADNQTTSLANQQSTSSGFTFNLNQAGSGVNYTSSQSQQNGVQVTYSTQQGSSLGQAVTTCGVLRDNGTDIDSITHKPKNPGGFAGPNVPDVYFDLTFGSFLVQDANEPAPDGTDYTSWPGFCADCNLTASDSVLVLRPESVSEEQAFLESESEGPLGTLWALEDSTALRDFLASQASTNSVNGAQPVYWLPPGTQWPARGGSAPLLPPPPGFPPPSGFALPPRVNYAPNSASLEVTRLGPPAAPLMLAPIGYVNGHFSLEVSGTAQASYVIEASTNLVHWTGLFTNTAPATPFQFSDPEASNFVDRFYRLRRHQP